MNEEIKNMLEEEIKCQFNDLSSLNPGTKERETTIEELSKLYKLMIEERKSEMEFSEKKEIRKEEDEIRKIQHAEQIKDRYFKLGIAAAELILPLMFYAVWMKRGFKFEEKGTYTSTTFRGLFNRFRPTK